MIVASSNSISLRSSTEAVMPCWIPYPAHAFDKDILISDYVEEFSLKDKRAITCI